MNNQKKHSINAFTIFEVTVVLAIMSVLVTMVTFSVNRLFDQMKVSEELHGELNDFYRVRSTLWYDCITADSVVCKNGTMLAYKKERTVHYTIDNEVLFRTQNGEKQELNVRAESITTEDTDEGEEIVVTLDWKGEPLLWKFFNLPNVAQGVNQYFDDRDG